MPFLTVDGVTIPVTPGGSSRRPQLIADQERVADATLRRMRIAVKNVWTVTTRLIPRATANTIYNTIVAAGTRTINGDLPGGAVTCFATIEDWQNVRVAQGDYVRLTFKLEEV